MSIGHIRPVFKLYFNLATIINSHKGSERSWGDLGRPMVHLSVFSDTTKAGLGRGSERRSAQRPP